MTTTYDNLQVDIGNAPNDDAGDTLRTAFDKINQRFAELRVFLNNRGDWAPNTAYTANPNRDWVIVNGVGYLATSNHTSGATFAADLAAGKWVEADALLAIADVDELRADLASTAAGKGAELVGFKQAEGVARTAESKLRDVVSVRDFGAVGDGVADDTGAFSAAGSSSSVVEVVIPKGVYKLNSNPAPSGDVTWLVNSGASFSGVGKLSGRVIQYGGGTYNHGSGATPETTRGLLVIQGPTTGAALSTEPNEVDFNLFNITGDQVDVEAGAGFATKANGLAVLHRFGGAGATGGRHSLYGFLQLTAPTKASSTDRNYVGVQGWALASANDTGTAIAKRGALFGGSFLGQLDAAATHFQNVTACEFNTNVAANTRPDYRSGIQIASRDFDRGVSFDAMISLSDISSDGNGKWRNAMLIGNQNGQQPLDPATGCIIKTVGVAEILHVIDVSSYVINGSIIKTAFVNLNENSLGIGKVNSSIELGSKSVANTPFIDLNSSGGNFDYDVRLIASGGGGVVGNGTLTVQAGAIVLPSDIRASGLLNFADDAAAAAGGVDVGRLYRNGSVVQVRVS